MTKEEILKEFYDTNFDNDESKFKAWFSSALDRYAEETLMDYAKELGLMLASLGISPKDLKDIDEIKSSIESYAVPIMESETIPSSQGKPKTAP